MKLTDALKSKEELESVLDVFTTTGWKLILRDIDEIYNAVNRIDWCHSQEDFNRKMGALEQMRIFQRLEDTYQRELENADL